MDAMKIMVLFSLFLLLFSVSAVAAGENMTSDESNGILMSGRGFDDFDSTSGENSLTSNHEDGSFTDLQNLIDSNVNGTISLDRNYAYDESQDSEMKEGVLINNKNIVFEGNNFIIDAKYKTRIFKIVYSNLTFNDIQFVNGNNSFKDENLNIRGGAIFAQNSILTFYNSKFINNSIYTDNDTNYRAIGYIAKYFAGGAIYTDGNVSCINCDFLNNSIICNGNLTNDFIDKTAFYGGAIYSEGDILFADSNSINNVIKFSINYSFIDYQGFVTPNTYFSSAAFYANSFYSNNSLFVNNSIILDVNYTTISGKTPYMELSATGGIIFTNNVINLNKCNFTDNYVNFDVIEVNSTLSARVSKFSRGVCLQTFDSNIDDSIFLNNHFFSTWNFLTRAEGLIYFNEYGIANVTDSLFVNNSAIDGGVFHTDSYSNLSVINCRFINNSANMDYGDGGAIYGDCFSIVLCDNCTFINNSAKCDGGALCIDCIGLVTILNSVFIDNHASIYGGAVFISPYPDIWFIPDQIFTIDNCSFINNTATSGGAIGVYWPHDEVGYNRPDILITNSLFADNSAKEFGGAIYNLFDDTYIRCRYCIFVNNSAGRGGDIATYGILNVRYSIFEGDNLGDTDYPHEKIFFNHDFSLVDRNYWCVNFTTPEEFINSGFIYSIGIDDNFYPERWILMSIYGNDSLSVGSNESFSVVFDKLMYSDGTVENFTNVLPDYWTRVYVYEGQLLTYCGLMGAGANSLLGAEADYNHEWDNENVDAGVFVADIWLRNNTGNFYYIPQKAGSYTFRTHSPFTNWEEAVFSTNAESLDVDLVVNKTASEVIVFVGDSVVWTITVVNNGLGVAFDAFVEDILPEGVSFVSANASKGSYNVSSGVWSIGDLAVNEMVTLDITTIVVGEVKSVCNSVFVNSSSVDSNMSNNYANASVNIILVADLLINKTVSSSVVFVGDRVVWTIIVINNGSSTAFNCVVNEVLSSGLFYVSSSASKGFYDFGSGIWSIGDLANGETATLHITTTVMKAGIIGNLVSVSSSTYDPNMTNNECFVNITAKVNETTPINNRTVPVNNKTIPQYNETIINDNKTVVGCGVKSVDVYATGNPIFTLLLTLFSLICLSLRKFN